MPIPLGHTASSRYRSSNLPVKGSRSSQNTMLITEPSRYAHNASTFHFPGLQWRQ
uniref:Uncharacterized protein n=1 Tax=Anguilla anguilla TaxID=7936 RepID=A0A0E9PPP9_ANGAN